MTSHCHIDMRVGASESSDDDHTGIFLETFKLGNVCVFLDSLGGVNELRKTQKLPHSNVFRKKNHHIFGFGAYLTDLIFCS